MKTAFKLALSLAVVLGFLALAQAADKEVTLKGTMVCGKCTLKLKGVTKCTNVLQVKEGGKTVN